MNAFGRQFAEFWRRADGRQRWILGGGGAGALVILAVGFIFGLRTEYRVLADGLAREDAARLLTRLDDSGIPYRVTDAGRALEVDASRFSEAEALRIQADVLAPKVEGYAGLFDGGFGLTRDQQKDKSRIALEQELARTITQVEGVESARVHLTPTHVSFNRRDSREAKASVAVHTKLSRLLSELQVEAIVQLVAHSVEGLDPAAVVVTDAGRGLVLTRRLPSSAIEGNLDDGRRAEEYLKEKAQSALDQSLGPRRAVVRVGVELEAESIKTIRQTPDPDSKVTVSEKVRSGTRGGASGVASVGALTASGPPQMTGGGSEEVEAVYAHGTTRVETIRSAGSIARVTVGLLVDDSLKDREEDLSSIVKGAVGFREGRDTMNVSFVPFAAPMTEVPVTPIPNGADATGAPLPRWISLTVPAVLVAVMLAWFAYGARRARLSLLKVTAPAVLKSSDAARSGSTDDLVHMRAEVKGLVTEDPARSQRLVRRWLQETAQKS